VSESAYYRADDLRKFCCLAPQALQTPLLDAEEVSECLAAADLRGVDSQGWFDCRSTRVVSGKVL
jgi:LDH2 family malate/lactate/ureidoglycolate dehydrogenase